MKDKVKAYLQKQAHVEEAGQYWDQAQDAAKQIWNNPYVFKGLTGAAAGAGLGAYAGGRGTKLPLAAMLGGLGGMYGLADAGLMDSVGIYGNK